MKACLLVRYNTAARKQQFMWLTATERRHAISIIAFDSHKHYTFARTEDKNGKNVNESRIEHRRGNIIDFLCQQQAVFEISVSCLGCVWSLAMRERSLRTGFIRLLISTDCRMNLKTSAIYLKCAFSEAGNSVAVNHKRCPQRHVSRLYERIRHRKNHAKAVGAVGRHLAEATYWMLTKGEAYRERGPLKVSSTGVQARSCHESFEARGMNATHSRKIFMPLLTAKLE